MKKRGILNLTIIIVIFSSLLIAYNVEACKDIVACGNSTAGDYNLLLKVRDPSRLGLQVLCIVPEGYEYDYHHPRSGEKISFTTIHKYIGVATEGDTIPNIIKSGMSLSKTGIAYGDADTNSKRVNPSKFAWDDFDWIRLACEKANDEDEAVEILTKEGVKQLHATGVSENLFVVGPKKGYVIEADAYQYKIKEIDNGIEVMSNYPKELWKTHRLTLFPISINFNKVVEKKVRVLSSVRLGSIFGIRITEIGDDYISAKPIYYFHAKRTSNLGKVTNIQLDERKTVGYFSVELLDINGNTARIRVTNIYKAWEEELLKQINSNTYGKINVKDMINFSRFDREDLNGLRPMCEPAFKYEAVAIYKIPSSNYEILSNGWFSANHACSSIYIPFHICNTDIYEPYKTGDAAQLCLDLYNIYDHDDLIPSFNKVENVFFNEMDEMEKISIDYIYQKTDVSEFLTVIDMSMQKQAYLTEEIWKEIDDKENIINVIANVWEENYLTTLENIKQALFELDEMSQTNLIKQKLIDISFDICNSRIEAADALEKEVDGLLDQLNLANNLVEDGQYEKGFKKLKKSYTDANMLIKGQVIVKDIVTETKNGEGNNSFLFFLIFVLIFVLIALFTRFKLNFQ
jgi:hypothetical protein